MVHIAEQRAAPYSMKSSATKRYTVDNNVNGTHNLLAAIVESGLDIHIVHLGTMGVYGYGSHRGATIPDQNTPNVSNTALVRGTSWVRYKSVLPNAANTAKNGSAHRTSSWKNSNA